MATGASDIAARIFVEEILRTGFMLIDLLSTLIEDLPDDAFQGADRGELVVDCLTGTLHPVVEAAGAEVVDQCTALLGAVGDRTRADLRRALEIARDR